MTHLPISFPELVDLMQSCTQVRAPECTPDRLRTLMVAQMTPARPGLARRVQWLADEHMRAITDYILLGLKLAAVPAA